MSALQNARNASQDAAVRERRGRGRRDKHEKDRKETAKKPIIVHEPIVRTNLIMRGEPLPQYPTPEEFDWDTYEAWNGRGMKPNTKVKTEEGDTVYCHEPYAERDYGRYAQSFEAFGFEEGSAAKDTEAGSVIRIDNVQLLGGDELLVSTAIGQAAVVNLAHEGKFFELFNADKSQFKELFSTPEGRKEFASRGFLARVNKNGRASLWDGITYQTEQEFMEQIALGDKAHNYYTAHIESSNRGGYIVTIRGIRAFLPGSQAATNRISDFEALVGKDLEVMIEGYDKRNGFIVSRKRWLRHEMPRLIKGLKAKWLADKDAVWNGTITGAKPFGAFVELNEFFTGLLHGMYASPELLDRLESGQVEAGEKIDVYIYDITKDDRGNDRIVLSDMPASVRKPIIEERERLQKIEDEKREAEHAARVKASGEAGFSGKSVSLEDLKALNKSKK